MLILIYLYVFSYKAFENSDRVVISYHRVDVVIRMYIYIYIYNSAVNLKHLYK